MNLAKKIALFVCISLFSASLGFVDSSWAGKGRKLTTPVLDPEEASTLSFMREEEKLARDVYIYLYGQWGAVEFANIASSEQRHMDAIKKKLDKYNLADPALEGEGEYSQEDLNDLYTDLTEQGDVDLIGAFTVGCLIEDLDIADLNEAIVETDNLDVQMTYENLRQGSENHLRAFVAALEAAGGSYTPQFITQEEFDEILGR